MIKIETKRCIVRKFVNKDIEEFMLYRNNEDWMQYQGFKGLSREEYANILLKDSSLEDGLQLAIVSKINNRLIGDIYLNKCEDGFWIGYTISPKYARQGYAYEIIMGLIDWIKIQGIKKICAGVLPENTASIGLLRKLGFNYIKKDDSGDEIYLLEV